MHSSLLSSPGYPASTRSITFLSFRARDWYRFFERTNFLNKKKVSFRKKLTMDEQNGSLWEIKQWLFFLKERKNMPNDVKSF